MNEEYEKFSEEEILIALGEELLSEAKNWIPLDHRELRAIAERYIAQKRQEICSRLGDRRDLFETETDEKKIAISIAEILSGLIVGMPLVLVSTLLAKKGAAFLCKEYWSE